MPCVYDTSDNIFNETAGNRKLERKPFLIFLVCPLGLDSLGWRNCPLGRHIYRVIITNTDSRRQMTSDKSNFDRV